MEGLLFAINNLISQQNSNLNPRLGSSNNALLAFNSEKQSYLSYYGTGTSPNLRLPTPPIPRENQHPGRHAVKFGTNWGLAPIDDNSKISLHLSQGVLSTHKEELEDDHSPKEPLDSLANTTNGFLSGDDAAPLAGQSKRLVDIIQEDFPRTPSPVYNQSRSLSPGTTDEAAEQDVFSGSLHDSTASTSNGIPSILGPLTQPVTDVESILLDVDRAPRSEISCSFLLSKQLTTQHSCQKIEEAKRDKEKDVDYLSSIEVLIIDHADVIAMQNWAFLTSVLEQLNCIPSKQHGTDIMRIRKWYLDGHARFYRQTIVLGCYANPDINASFNRQCVNYQGKVKLICQYKGVLPKVSDQVRQIYQRFDADSVAEADNARLDYFVQKVFPKIKDSDEGGVMLFISSYYEYVRLRNFLKSQNASLCLLGDYAEPRDVTRMRNWFRNGEKKIMLYTERFHFYRRYKIGGVRNLIVYSLPERKEFFPEVVNMLEGADDMTCTVLFSQFDQLQLERIVGTASARRMITSEKGVFVFC
ncbi:hypothetical protein POTOM_013031 [Populus tomentosa]|uniref:U3 small nucleolar RNA-associated protein 25 n=1 Tax=Populus tomentosa TaxID=118781 RepID=A0A8X8A525_POPTO|nr:hypothetical protein POTOM_013031 [Populus tomentosa]